MRLYRLFVKAPALRLAKPAGYALRVALAVTMASALIGGLVITTGLATTASAGIFPTKLVSRLAGESLGRHLAKGLIGAHQEDAAEPKAAEPSLLPEGVAADSTALEAIDQILLSPDPYNYGDPTRRDPFVSLVGDDYLEEHGDDETKLSSYTVVGILWGDNDRFALLESEEGSSIILHEGDRLGQFSVTRIEPGAVLFYTSDFGVGRTERLLLQERKGNQNGRDGR
jgi:hypothetical protein